MGHVPEKHLKSTKKSGKPAKAKSLALAENKADILCYEARKNQKKRPFDDVMRQWGYGLDRSHSG